MLRFDPASASRQAVAGMPRAVLFCLCLAGAPVIAAAQGLDMDTGTTPLPAAPAAATPSVGGLDSDVNPAAPIPSKPAGQAGDVRAGITPLGAKITPDATPATLTGPEPASQSDHADATPSRPEPVTLEHAKVIDTAKLQAGDTTVSLFGIEGLGGDSAQGLQAYLGQNDKPLTCQAKDGTAFVCLMGDGTDVALVALVNGAARTKAEAPDVYREQELDAQKNRRGLWARLPPPPETVKHPIVKDTATLTADGKTYILDTVVGLGTPYNSQLQSYIVANGDSMTCMPQGPQDHFVCLMPDGTDLAKAALVNGAARVPPAAPPAYRTQQLDALNNHRGYWASAPQDAVALALATPPPDQNVLVAGDDGADGITYVNSVPVAVIDGEPDPVFLVYEDDVGWGYYGHDHYWHRAPDRYWHHLDHFHHEGAGLRGYEHGHFASYGHEVHGGPGGGHDGMVHEAGLHAEGRVEGHPALEGRAAFHEGAGRPAAPHMGEVREAGMRPEMRAPAARPGGGFGGGGGFMRPAPQASMGGFHQGLFGGGGMARAAPAAHVASGGGGGRHK